MFCVSKKVQGINKMTRIFKINNKDVFTVQCPFSMQCCQVVKYALSKGIQTKINEDIVDFCNVKNQKEWEKIIHYLCSGGCASLLKAKFKFKGN